MATPLDIEDLKIYFYDTFLSTDQFDTETIGTAQILFRPSDTKISAGVTQNSYALVNYKGISFNPLYSEIIFKLRLNSKRDLVAFWGFKSTLSEPTLNMTESHCGFLIYNNKTYFTSADGYTQQLVEVNTIDPTLMYEYKIKYNEFYYKPLPQVETYLGLPSVRAVDRVWKLLQTNSIYAPENKTHYIMIFIKNKTTTEKYISLNRVIYKEEYAD